MKEQKAMFCLEKKDISGNPLNMTLFGKEIFQVHRSLVIKYSPCMPKQISDFNLDANKCVINDIHDPKQLDQKLSESTAYVDSAKFTMLYNFQQFSPSGSIVQQSQFISRQFYAKFPSFAQIPVSINAIQDEQYMNMKMAPNEFSSWLAYPTHYKFFSVHFELS